MDQNQQNKSKETSVSNKIISLSKRRGFVYPSSEIYGGFSATYDYGPLGAQMLKNIKDLWWKSFVESRLDVVGLDGSYFFASKNMGGEWTRSVI